MELVRNIEHQEKLISNIKYSVKEIWAYLLVMGKDIPFDNWWMKNSDSSTICMELEEVRSSIFSNIKKLHTFTLRAEFYLKQMKAGKEFVGVCIESDMKLQKMEVGNSALNTKIECDTSCIKNYANKLLRHVRYITDLNQQINSALLGLDIMVASIGNGKGTLQKYRMNIFNNLVKLADIGKTMKKMAENYETAEKKVQYAVSLIDNGIFNYSMYANDKESWNNFNSRWNAKVKRDNSVSVKISKTCNNLKKTYTDFYAKNQWYQIGWEITDDMTDILSNMVSFKVAVAKKDFGEVISSIWGMANGTVATGYDLAALAGCCIQEASGVDLSKEIKKARETEDIAGHYEYYEIKSTIPKVIDTVDSIYGTMTGVYESGKNFKLLGKKKVSFMEMLLSLQTKGGDGNIIKNSTSIYSAINTSLKGDFIKGITGLTNPGKCVYGFIDVYENLRDLKK